MRKLLITLAVTTLLASSAYAQERDAAEENAATKRSYSPYAGSEQPRNVYWGDTHLHTTYSADAGLVGNSKLGPDEAYRFARGDEIVTSHGERTRLNQPLIALGQEKKMLTEAQCEYAARGGLKKKVYTWGDQPDHIKKKLMNFWEGEFPYKNSGSDGHLITSPVGSFPVNGYGLYDMAGNVWEWVSDWYHPRYYEVSPKKNPTGVIKEHNLDPHEPGIPKRIVKGGSFLCSENYCTGYRPSSRMATDPRSSSNHTGFRCVKNKKI